MLSHERSFSSSNFLGLLEPPCSVFHASITHEICMRECFRNELCLYMCVSHVRLCDPMDCTLIGSSTHGVFQARILEWVAISFSRGSGGIPGIDPASPALQADSLSSEPPGKLSVYSCLFGCCCCC